VPALTKRVDDLARYVLVGEETHRSGFGRVDFLGLKQVTSISEAGPDIGLREARVAGHDLLRRPALSEESDNVLNGNSCPSDDRLAGQNLRIENDPTVAPPHYALSPIGLL